MSKHRSRKEWIEILENAARSGMSVSDFCRQNDISKNLFYRNSLKFGFTKDGKRTEKWINAASSAGHEDPAISSLPALVPVPAQTIRAAWSQPDPDAGRPQIAILHDSFRVIVGDDFSQDTLRRVLEVMRDA